ncbi:MAG: ExeM/NucH family extracellular endonuclease [Gammaproteobacteria bacterium]|nr:ExeM/NucH family extracellular endonuclease [Gammaproteobacteria bacterium]
MFSSRHWFTLLSVAVLPSLASTNQLLITEYLEGSANNKAIEVSNRSATSINLGDYQLAVYFNGNTNAGATIELSGELAAGDSYVIAHRDASSEILAQAQITYGGGLFNGDDAVALLYQDTIIDSLGQIGVDPGSRWGDAPTTTQNATLRRNVNVLEGRRDAFTEFDVSAQWQGFAQDDASDLGRDGSETPVPIELGECGAPFTSIAAIQGAGEASEKQGETVVIEAVVTYNGSAAEQLSGLYLQSARADEDNNPATSEGLFVYTANQTIPAQPGQRLRIAATVAEYYGQTQLSDLSAWRDCGAATVAPIATLSIEQGNLPNLEPFEGMLITFNQPLTVIDHTGLARYGELLLSSSGRQMIPTEKFRPGTEASNLAAQNQTNRIVLDDGSTRRDPNPVPYPAGGLTADHNIRIGDQVTAVTGVLGYGFNQYRIHPLSAVNFLSANPRPNAPAPTTAEQLTVASFNVLNYFNGDGQGGDFPTPRGADNAEELQRQQGKLVAALSNLDADIVGLMEIENDGFGQYSAIAQLTQALNDQRNQDDYAYIEYAESRLGSDQITVGLLYKPGKVQPIGRVASTSEVPFDYGNRQPLVVTFKERLSQRAITVAVNHFKSKGGCPRDGSANENQNDGQGCWNQLRTEAAAALAQWLLTSPTQANSDGTIILGDLNAYGQEDPLVTLQAQGYRNSSAASVHIDYSYQYQGESGSLDHILVDNSLAPYVVTAEVWHINADEMSLFDYNLEGKDEIDQDRYYRADSFRASDHDPKIITLNLLGTHLNQAPVADFKIYNGFFFSYFKNTSFDNDGQIQTHQWQFSDGYTSTRRHLLRFFWPARGQSVTLTVEDDRGASASKTVNR